MTTTNVYDLARIASVYTPDSETSPGADFLRWVRDSYVEAREEGRLEERSRDDLFHEIADGAVPIYTHPMFLTFIDLGAYEEDPSELIGPFTEVIDGARASLYIIALRLVEALVDEDDRISISGRARPLHSV